MKFIGYFAIILFVCSILLLGFARNTRAQVPCTNPGLSTSLAFSIEWSAFAAEIMSSQSIIQAFYTLAEKAVKEAVMEVIDQVTNLGEKFKDEFMDFDLRPAMQDMTAELHTAITDASRAMGGCIDAQEFAKVALRIKDLEVEAQRLARPSVLQCQAATVLGGLFRQDTIKQAYERAAPIERAPVSAAKTGTPAAQGDDVYLRSMWTRYCTRYADHSDNGGNIGCPPGPPTPFTDEDVNPNNIFEDTYDVTDVDKKANLDDFVRNICGTIPIRRATLEEMSTIAGKKVFIDGMSRMAQEQLCYTALYSIQAKRVPGSQMYNELLPHITKAGINLASLPANPSWTTIENVLEASMSQDFQTQLVDEPDAVQRFLIIPDVYARTFGVNEIKDMQERTGAILAVLGARELKAVGNAEKYDIKPR